jgi:predicted nicotinamide N-methyase
MMEIHGALTVFGVALVQNKPGVTGAVLWDSVIMLGKFLEHSHDSRLLSLKGKRCIELGAGCGFVG